MKNIQPLPVVGDLYFLSGTDYSQEALEVNKNVFRVKEVREEYNEVVFEGITNGVLQYAVMHGSERQPFRPLADEYKIAVNIDNLKESPWFEGFSAFMEDTYVDVKRSNLFAGDNFPHFVAEKSDGFSDYVDAVNYDVSELTEEQDYLLLSPKDFMSVMYAVAEQKKKKEELAAKKVKKIKGKRAKGVPERKRTVNKATVFFTSGEQYTIKGFKEVGYTAGGNLMFCTIAEEGETFIRYSDLWEMSVEDIESVVVLGVNKSFCITQISAFSARLSAPDFETTTTSFNFKV